MDEPELLDKIVDNHRGGMTYKYKRRETDNIGSVDFYSYVWKYTYFHVFLPVGWESVTIDGQDKR